MSASMKDAGWFYHAPCKKNATNPVGAPPPSQIPGLGEIGAIQKEQPKEMVFRATDSKYIRKAKMGGIKDLLSIEPNTKTDKPVWYARNNWFYLEDNALEDQKEEKPASSKFLLPEYMVQENENGIVENAPCSVASKDRAPYATDNVLCEFTDDGHSMADKTVKIPEVRQPGYGVRNGQAVSQTAKDYKLKPPSSEKRVCHGRKKFFFEDADEPTIMSKLLSNTYEKEWFEKLSNSQLKPAQNTKNFLTTTNNNSSGKQFSTSNESSLSLKQQEAKEGNKEREPFRLNKFKNVPARVSSNATPDIMADVEN